MKGLKVGLIHQGWPAGSFITTRGLERALNRRDDIDSTVRVAASELEQLPDNLDFIFVEGFPGKKRWPDLNALRTPKFFWWLSMNFGRMSPELLAESTFDHVFTNSQWALEQLAPLGKPVSFMALAFDRQMAEEAEVDARYDCDVTYLGTSGHKSRAQLNTILKPAQAFDFQLWGKGWQWTRMRKFHRGLLSAGDIPKLYASAHVVLGMTEQRQQTLGMINNRVFEALGCGATYVVDHFDALEAEFGDYISCVRSAEETRAAIERVLADPSAARERGRAAQAFVLERHTYDLRVEQVLTAFREQIAK